MRDFADELDGRLRRVAALAEPTGLSVVGHPAVADPIPVSWSYARSQQRRAVPRRRVLLSGIAALGTLTASTVALSGSTAVGLPILADAASDASSVPGLVAFRSNGVDPTRAHGFRAGDRQAFVLSSDDGNRLCVAFPDPLITDTADYSGNCAATQVVERRGLLVEATGSTQKSDPVANTFAFILPLEAADVSIVGADHTVTRPRIERGVVTATIYQASRLVYRVAGQRRSTALDQPLQPLQRKPKP
jgi:hypothetical protein